MKGVQRSDRRQGQGLRKDACVNLMRTPVELVGRVCVKDESGRQIRERDALKDLKENTKHGS